MWWRNSCFVMPNAPTTRTRVVEAGPDNIDQAARALCAGRLVAFPTDTVYGVGAHGLQADAIAQLYEVKQRPSSKPIALLVAAPADVQRVARAVPDAAWRLVESFWPGALTLIVPRSFDLPTVLTAGGNTVAVRMPDHPVALALIAAAGAPLAATSANVSGGPDPITAADVLAELGGRIELVIDAGACPRGLPSTVLDLSTDPPTLRRAGPISVENLAAVLETRITSDR
jgi:L-threonylcarbamoyladenylate synthase